MAKPEAPPRAPDAGDRVGRRSRPDGAEDPAAKVPALPWMRVPLTFEASDGTLLEDVGGLDPLLLEALRGMGIEALFPVQTTLWRTTGGGRSTTHDICVSAPTGSGKTLAYSLPVLQSLLEEGPGAARGPRALAVVPTRDLARQVTAMLRPLCEASGLRLALLGGGGTHAEEAADLLGNAVAARLDPLVSRLGSSARADVVVATPGRLVQHIGRTPGLTLRSVRWLVVDETDRLLRQSYHGWLATVLGALQGDSDGPTRPPGAPPAPSRRVVKVVASATLTRDPGKLARLGLEAPRFVALAKEEKRYVLPRSLVESWSVTPAALKPHTLVALLAALQRSGPGHRAIVFANSLETTARLAALLQALGPDLVGTAAEYSSSTRPAARAAALRSFADGRTRVLIASDAMTRGIDVPGIDLVVNYDPPTYPKTYVHRAGRTARAGRLGAAHTLLRREDVRHFKLLLRKVDNTFVKEESPEVEGVREAVDAALQALPEALAGGGDPAGSKRHRAGGHRAKRPRLVGLPEISLA